MFQPVKLSKVGQLASIGVLSLSLFACGNDDSDPASPLRTGVFLDSAPVEGLNYVTATMSGETDADGEFNFNAGEMITFSIGGLELPEVQASNTVTPITLFANDEESVADLSRLLQSLDEDGVIEDSISLSMNIQSITSDTQIDFGEDAFDAQAQALLIDVNGPQATLIEAETASANLNQALVDNELISEDCTAEHPMVGRSMELSSLAHGVSGTVTVMNDCELEVTNFNYDGGGPNVFFFAAVDRAYSSNYFVIGPQLNGQRWVNDTLRLPIPEGKSLDDFNSLSVWCSDFNANFGEVFFGES